MKSVRDLGESHIVALPLKATRMSTEDYVAEANMTFLLVDTLSAYWIVAALHDCLLSPARGQVRKSKALMCLPRRRYFDQCSTPTHYLPPLVLKMVGDSLSASAGRTTERPYLLRPKASNEAQNASTTEADMRQTIR